MSDDKSIERAASRVELQKMVDNGLGGWEVQKWFQLVAHGAGIGDSSHVVGYFTDKDVATVYGQGQGDWGGDADGLYEVYVLVPKHGEKKFAFLIDNLQRVQLTDGGEAMVKARKKALDKLTPEDRKVLGLDGPAKGEQST